MQVGDLGLIKKMYGKLLAMAQKELLLAGIGELVRTICSFIILLAPLKKELETIGTAYLNIAKLGRQCGTQLTQIQGSEGYLTPSQEK